LVINIQYVGFVDVKEAVATRDWGSRYKLPGHGGPEGEPVPDWVVYFMFC